jgi:hypothetical protein
MTLNGESVVLSAGATAHVTGEIPHTFTISMVNARGFCSSAPRAAWRTTSAESRTVTAGSSPQQPSGSATGRSRTAWPRWRADTRRLDSITDTLAARAAILAGAFFSADGVTQIIHPAPCGQPRGRGGGLARARPLRARADERCAELRRARAAGPVAGGGAGGSGRRGGHGRARPDVEHVDRERQDLQAGGENERRVAFAPERDGERERADKPRSSAAQPRRTAPAIPLPPPGGGVIAGAGRRGRPHAGRRGGRPGVRPGGRAAGPGIAQARRPAPRRAARVSVRRERD